MHSLSTSPEVTQDNSLAFRSNTALRSLPREGPCKHSLLQTTLFAQLYLIVAIQLGCYSTSQTSCLNTSASRSLTCRSLRECCSSLILSYKSYLVMKEAVLLNKLLPHHLGKFDGLHHEVQAHPAISRKHCSPLFQTGYRTTSRLPIIPNSSTSGKTSTPLPAIPVSLSTSSPVAP